MRLSLKNIGKRYNFEWIFRGVNLELESGKQYAVLGPNGSGKSTLLQIIAGSLSHSEGSVDFITGDQRLRKEDIAREISLAAPYLELIEEFSLYELLNFHQQFKPLIKECSKEEIAESVYLGKALHKQIRYYSSGMKQRAKLALAFFSAVPVLLLDEPCTNLDQEGTKLYRDLLSRFSGERLTIISSNSPQEYAGSDDHIDVRDFK